VLLNDEADRTLLQSPINMYHVIMFKWCVVSN